jgi:hypothetical protein
VNRLARARCAYYVVAFLALAHVATMRAVYGTWWAAVAFGAASLAPVVAAWMEGEHSVHQHRAAHVMHHLAADLSLSEERRLHLMQPALAIEECCELWWTSAGAEHETDCHHHETGRRAA